MMVQLIIAVGLMFASIWFIAFGIGMFVEADHSRKDSMFPLSVLLTAIGAFIFCASMFTLMLEAIRATGSLS